MNWIDVAIASLVLIAGLGGWTRGLVRQFGALVGRLVGLVGGLYLAVWAAPRVTASAWRPLDVVLIIVASTVAGGLIFRYLGGVFSRRIHEGRLGVVDSFLGACVGVAGMLLSCWLVAALLTVVPWSTVGASINRSVILRYVQRVLPTPPAVVGRLQGVLSQLNVPSLFADVVGPALPTYATRPFSTRHHVATPTGVVSVVASGACHVTNVATGVVVAPHEVLTLAHVVAGERTFTVAGRAGRVVAFDPVRDLAVVSAPGLDATPLALAATSPSKPLAGALAQVVGYRSPTDRAATQAVVAGTVTGAGRDIYSGPVFTRTMDVVVASLTPSQYGGPVLVNDQVVGIVAQRVAADRALVYAVPLRSLRVVLAHVSTTPVSTQRCVN
ncbi:MAG: MarP family serine protease [Acidobacteria bacterium]|nr:MarP family serine protease [Acidobacteriota bacterium]